MALVNKQAALYVKDADAVKELIPLALKTVVDTNQLNTLGENAYRMAYKDSARVIAEEVLKLIKK